MSGFSAQLIPEVFRSEEVATGIAPRKMGTLEVANVRSPGAKRGMFGTSSWQVGGLQ